MAVNWNKIIVILRWYWNARSGETIARIDNYCEIDPNVVDGVRNTGIAISLQMVRLWNQTSQTYAGNFHEILRI